jgi:hypothetical protein
MRLGVSLDLDADEVEMLLGKNSSDEKISNVIRNAVAECRFVLEGETYAPEKSIEDFNDEYGTNYPVEEIGCDL